MHISVTGWLIGRLTTPFSTKIGYICTQDLVPDIAYIGEKWETIREAHLSYYASAYNKVKTNKPPQDLFIISYLV